MRTDIEIEETKITFKDSLGAIAPAIGLAMLFSPNASIRFDHEYHDDLIVENVVKKVTPYIEVDEKDFELLVTTLIPTQGDSFNSFVLKKAMRLWKMQTISTRLRCKNCGTPLSGELVAQENRQLKTTCIECHLEWPLSERGDKIIDEDHTNLLDERMLESAYKNFKREIEIDQYPAWICHSCALSNHGKIIQGHEATFHQPDKDNPHDKCGWCGRNDVALTEPRDFGYPIFGKKESRDFTYGK